jgi:hypothetical protein
VVEKGEVQSLAVEVLFWMMDHSPQLLLNAVNENMLHKNPKICSYVLWFLEKLLSNYGAKKLKQLEYFGPSFKLLAEAVRPIAKTQTINLFKEMYRWMGDGVFGFAMSF